MIWTEKYRPRAVEEMVGNELARAQFYRWLKGWTPGTKPALLLGPPGTGKTTLVHAAAGELGYEVIELNASDYRTKEALERRIKPAMGGVTVFGNRLLVFLDEVDGLYGRADYGGSEYVASIMSSIRVPLVMAANSEDVDYMRGLEKEAMVIRFRRVPARLIELYLRHVLRSEGVELGEDVLQGIVKYARGDVRAAVNALEAASLSGEFQGGFKDVQLDIREAIERAAYARYADDAYAALRSCDAQPQEKIRAAYAAIAMSEMDPGRRSRAMRALSDADILYSRIIRSQNWGLLRYLDRMLASALSGTFAMYSEYDAPYQVSSRAWGEGRALDKVAGLMAKELHMSKGEFMMYAFDAMAASLPENEEALRRVAELAGVEEEALRDILSRERARLLGEEAAAEEPRRARRTPRGRGGRRAEP